MTQGARERRSREQAECALAWIVTGLAAIVAAVVLWLFFATELDDTYLLFGGVVGLSFPVVGATVVTRRPGHAIGWLFVVIGAGMSLAGDSSTVTLPTASRCFQIRCPRPVSLPGCRDGCGYLASACS